LGAHQGYVLYPDGHCTQFPVWFAPWFETAPEPPQAPETSVAVQPCLFGPDYLRGLMGGAGCRVVCLPEAVQAAFDLCRPQERKGRLLARVVRFFRTRTGLVPAGLESLPRCWLAALPAVLSGFWVRWPAEPPCPIGALACREGMLLLRFAQEPACPEDGIALGDRIRVAINASLYPTVWRPLLRRHRAAIWRTRPELHAALTVSLNHVDRRAWWTGTELILEHPVLFQFDAHTQRLLDHFGPDVLPASAIEVLETRAFA